MGRALSCDLRDRVLQASREGASARQAAAGFGVNASSAIRWIARAGQGETAPRKSGRKTTSRLDPHKDFIVALIEDRKDITLDEMVVRLAEDSDMKIGLSMLNKWLRSRRFTYKKDRSRIGAGAPKPDDAPSVLVRQPA